VFVKFGNAHQDHVNNLFFAAAGKADILFISANHCLQSLLGILNAVIGFIYQSVKRFETILSQILQTARGGHQYKRFAHKAIGSQ
jgi:hypothetical protein